jgi:hypothetical protein
MAEAKFIEGQIVIYDPCAENMPPAVLAQIFRVHDGPAYTEPLYGIEWGKSNKATVREGSLSPAGDLAPELQRAS